MGKKINQTAVCGSPGLLIASDPLSSTVLVQTLTRLTSSLKCQWTGCSYRSSHCRKFVPGTLSEAWKKEETDMSNYPRIVQLLAFGAGRHSHWPSSPSSTTLTGKWEGR